MGKKVRYLVFGLIGLLAVSAVVFYSTRQKEKIADEKQIIEEKPQTEPTTLFMEASNQTDSGIAINSAFMLRATEFIDEKMIRENLKVEPEMEYDITKQTDHEFKIVLKKALSFRSIVKFTYEGKESRNGWAFQTVDTFRVKSTYPANDAREISVKTGIEFEFTSTAAKNIEDFLTIEPAVKFKVTYEDNKVILQPEQLEKDVNYQVTIKAGYGTGADNQLAEDYRFVFMTNDPNSPYSSTYLNTLSLTSSNTQRLNMPNLYNEGQYHMKLYALDSMAVYAQKIAEFEKTMGLYRYPVNKMTFEGIKPIIDTDVALTIENYAAYVSLPEGLGKGLYCAEVTGDQENQFVFFQISDYVTYVEKTDDQILLHIINSATKKPANDADVLVAGKSIGKTDKDGVLLTSITDTEANFYTVQTADDIIAIKMNVNPWIWEYRDYYYESDLAKDNLVFTYTDRSTYQPTDRVEFFGTIKPQKASPLKEITVTLGNEIYNSGASQSLVVPVDGNYRSFEGGFDLSNWATGYYELTFSDGDKILSRQYISVEKYEKPEYVVALELDKKMIALGESFNAKGSATYFDTTPLKEYPLVVRDGVDYWDMSSEQSIDTDKSGQFATKITPEFSYDTWRPYYYNVNVKNANAENNELNGVSKEILVFPSDMTLRGTMENVDGKAVITVKTAALKVNEALEDFGMDYENFETGLINKKVHVVVRGNYYEPVLRETVYDPVLKINKDIYDYEYREEVTLDQEVTTVKGTAQLGFTIDPKMSYTAEISSVDGNGTTLIERSYLYTNYQATSETVVEQTAWEFNNLNLKTGDLIENRLVVPSTNDAANDHYLFIVHRNGIMKYSVSTEPVYKDTFTADYVPNVIVKPIYFNGNQFDESAVNQELYVQLDLATVTGGIAITTDKSNYLPGETAVVTLQTTDAAGNPIPMKVNINTVDEAYLAIYGDSFNIVNDYYAYVYSTGVRSVQMSDKTESMAGMAEGGEGDAGSVYVRSNFKDTAYFKTVETDANGAATISIKVPDNLTTWRVTANGITKDEIVAHQTNGIQVQIPFFVRGIFGKTYLLGEQPSINVRSDGNAVTGIEKVKYTVEITDPNGDVTTQEVIGRAKDYTHISIELKSVGKYTYSVTGQTSQLKDALKGTFEVVESRVAFDEQKSGSLDNTFKLSNPEQNTQMVLMNVEAEQFMADLSEILYLPAERVEWIIAQYEAAKLLSPDENEWARMSNINLIDSFINGDGGIKTLVGGESDPIVTAKLAAMRSEALQNVAVVPYLYNAIDSNLYTADEVAIMLYGLAGQNEPVLNMIQSLRKEKLTDLSKSYLALALNELGDYNEAVKIFVALNEAYNQNNTIKVENVQLAYEMALLAVKLDNNAIGSLYFRAAQESTKPVNESAMEKYVYSLDQVNYLKYAAKTVPTTTVKYEIGGVEKVVEMSTMRPETILIDGSVSDTFKITQVDGEVSYLEYFTSNLQIAAKNPSTKMKITKSVDMSSGVFSDYITVTLTVNYPNETYAQVTDTVPSGFTFVDFIPSEHCYGWVQEDTLHISGWSNTNTYTIQYRLRANQVGTFRLEPAVAQSKWIEATNWSDSIEISVE